MNFVRWICTKFGDWFGTTVCFTICIWVLLVWVGIGPHFHWDNTWQLIANTPTTWLELFAAISIQYTGNKIMKVVLDYLRTVVLAVESIERSEAALKEHVERVESHLGISSPISTDISPTNAPDASFIDSEQKMYPAAPGTVIRPDFDV